MFILETTEGQNKLIKEMEAELFNRRFSLLELDNEISVLLNYSPLCSCSMFDISLTELLDYKCYTYGITLDRENGIFVELSVDFEVLNENDPNFNDYVEDREINNILVKVVGFEFI